VWFSVFNGSRRVLPGFFISKSLIGRVGLMHFPVERDEEYFQQLTAQEMVMKYKAGFAFME